jgi:epoxyqueuosine reductase QueG
MKEITSLFKTLIQGKKGIIGAAPFQKVYANLMPVQQKKLLQTGEGKSLIVFGVFHSQKAIESINLRKNGKTDYAAWNRYAREYHELNHLLNSTAQTIAEHVDGYPLYATVEGVASTLQTVKDFYALTVSQRVGAELAGLGWRGKNELIVTKEGCAVRFASVICPEELPFGEKMDNFCGDCTACLDVCPFLRKKETLKNYREQCRRFIVTLKLQGDVCGKCVKACYHHWHR